jgi:predicted ArsR family transcriptional regulator
MLRGIAHPMRNRILEELSAAGPMRAADIAAALDIPANQASFHLRQLAKYGLVEEAPELARDGRDRVWRLLNEAGWTVDLDELAKQEGGKAAVAVFRKQWTADAHAAVERAASAEREKDTTVAVSSSAVRLTRKQARELATLLSDLVEDWRVRGQEPAEGARTYEVLWVLQPAPEPPPS